MSGHSKWATIHRKKGLLDAARGKVFQKLAKEIMVAAKGGSPDPNQNASLRLAVDKAKAQNMPKENIQKAIEKATGGADGANFESVRYEGYGHGGVAFMVDCLTDNRNRTASQVRAAFTKAGGNLGTDGSVSYMFERRGSIVIPGEYDEDTMMMAALDAGALDFEHVEDSYMITTDATSFTAVKDALEAADVKEFLECELTYMPNMEVELDEEGQEKVMKLVDALEDLDDVQDVYYNLKETE
ncbi:MAG: YebC/PmpR family DNA-binding transcriptional regulator [Bacilli bacterium]|nr:YebC/PmpR family DNA-binding transcriptional regulator [Bacilli bacterium]MBR6137493.1 YebC/PmpR family DNA-binding transcriptional regulator [Bacilli bacterium]